LQFVAIGARLVVRADGRRLRHWRLVEMDLHVAPIAVPDWLLAVQRQTGPTMIVRGLQFRQKMHFFLAIDRRPNPCRCPMCIAFLIESLTVPTLKVAQEQFLVAAAPAPVKPGFFRTIINALKELLV
jgi:hypothetical protein